MLPAGTKSTVAAQEYRFLAQGWGRAVPPQRHSSHQRVCRRHPCFRRSVDGWVSSIHVKSQSQHHSAVQEDKGLASEGLGVPQGRDSGQSEIS